MKRYEAYIETTVNWMGSIPSNWILSKLKYEVKCLDGSRVPVEKSQRNEGPYPYWGAGSITCYVDNYLFDEELVLLGEDGAPFFDPYRPVAFYVNEKVWVNNHIHVLKPQNRVIGKYLTYLLNTVDYGNHINGSILNKLTQYNMDEIAVCLPSIEEQKIIAAYLDCKVGQIDKSISEIDSQIDSLKSYRQSVISEAVTKGLDKNVRMKDSGIEWIGEIPEGWMCLPMKRGLIINNGKDYKDVQSEDGFPVIGSGGQFAFASKYLYDGEAVLFGRKGTIDKPMYVNGKFWTVDTMFYATPLQNVVTKYMYYQALTIPFGKYSTNTALPSMTQSDLADNPMCFPSLEEQKIIAAYLDYKVGQVDEAINALDAQRTDLNALKQSIISEAVTGKIDLREWTPSVEQ